jgi:glycosyltransferase involved in cell wall biosynthesis
VSNVLTVAIPTLNAGVDFAETLAAVRAQRIGHELQVLVCDSGSSDQTVRIARAYGADVMEIPRESFSHGGTRNMLMSEARGEHVAFLTQDAVPVGEQWLARLLAGFALALDVGLVFGPYRPRPDAGLSVARELNDWFGSFSADGGPRVDVLPPERRNDSPSAFLGHVGFFTDANGCIARRAWERVPFRDIGYAEDHLLAQDMLRAGFAKVYMPDAAVVHSHDYSPWQWLRRSFDESRAVAEVYGVSPAGRLADAARNLRGNVAADVRWARAQGRPAGAAVLTASLIHHGARGTGAVLGAHSARLPSALTAQLSLEGRRSRRPTA